MDNFRPIENDIKIFFSKRDRVKFLLFHMKDMIPLKKKSVKNFREKIVSISQVIEKEHEQLGDFELLILKTIGYKWFNKQIFEQFLKYEMKLDKKWEAYIVNFLSFKKSVSLANLLEGNLGVEINKFLQKSNPKKDRLNKSIGLFFQMATGLFDMMENLISKKEKHYLNRRDLILLNSVINEVHLILDLISDISRIDY